MSATIHVPPFEFRTELDMMFMLERLRRELVAWDFFVRWTKWGPEAALLGLLPEEASDLRTRAAIERYFIIAKMTTDACCI